MNVHVLKCWPEEFRAVALGDKTADFRRNDRDFRVGDTLLLREWNPETGRFTGHHIDCGSISHIQSGGRFGIPDGYCLLSFRWPIYISYAPPHPESDPCSASSSALPSSSSSAPPSVD
jgi:hypothetical protein